MFYYFNGEVTLLESNLAVIDCGGVGYGPMGEYDSDY